MDTIKILIEYHEAFLKGLAVTFQLFLIVVFFGVTIGGSIGWCSKKFPDFGKVIKIIAFILGGIPTLVFLIWMHYPLQASLGIVVDPFITAAVTFSILNIFMISNLVYKTMDDFPGQYLIAAKVNGLTTKQTICKIELPIIFQNIFPALLMSQVVMLHTTLFASLISVEEIFRISQQINAMIYKPVEIYTALGVFFLAVSLPINGFALYLKKKYTRDLSEK